MTAPRFLTARRLPALAFVSCVSLLVAPAAPGQDRNVTVPVADLERMLDTESLEIRAAEISRPKARGDITLKADVSFGGSAPLRVKLRKAEPGAEEFNNVPRYDLAAYELQKLFLDPAEYVVPPTALRMVPLADFQRYSPDVRRTFPPAEQVLGVVQYWLQDVKVIADVYDPARFAADPVYARHIGQLNILTHLINHRDSNAGNFLIGRQNAGARVFSVDHGVAFGSEDSDRGKLWRDMRVQALPADAVAKLRQVTPEVLEARLGVLAQWQLRGGAWQPVPPGPNLAPRSGVRREGDMLQMGLTVGEINAIERLLERLLRDVDRGAIVTLPAPAPPGAVMSAPPAPSDAATSAPPAASGSAP
jgi:hypothetical protein